MAQKELTGKRDLTYPLFHRTDSLARFVPYEDALRASCIDMDAMMFVEYKDGRHPIALMEFAHDKPGAPDKASTITRALAEMAGIPAFVVLYTRAAEPNPTAPEYPDISMLRVKKVFPEPASKWMAFTPAMWAKKLLALRGYCADVAGMPLPERETEAA